MRVFITILLFVCISCTTTKKVIKTADRNQPEISSDFRALKPLLVYKTKANYNNLVPVILSADKTEIISYPHPDDIKTGNKYSIPVILHNGYLLDQRGIGKNVAFLNMTYEEYAKLKVVPTIKELYNLIVDKDPLIELCNCGTKYAFSDPINQLNELIDSNKLKTICK
ncbi:MAG: hypothetical protein Q8T08_05795 [Ignavibacteria bacterium]|nr:hypothetical protein [Ignavibacteria bacterium]